MRKFFRASLSKSADHPITAQLTLWLNEQLANDPELQALLNREVNRVFKAAGKMPALRS